jgi:hypothetical protein
MLYTDFNTFRHKDGPALRCAVPAGRPLPSFLREAGWEWNAPLRTGQPTPKGFRVEAAVYVSDLSGYYFYSDWQEERRPGPSPQGSGRSGGRPS